MSLTIYGVIDKNENIRLSTGSPDAWLLYDAYEREGLLKKFHADVKKKFLKKSKTDTVDEDEFYEECFEEHFPKSDYEDFEGLTKEGDLKEINFDENAWQDIMIFFDNYSNFPAKNLCIISAEESNEDSQQRVDLLYLRSDGKILPAEIKISDNGIDAHGQLIRYMAGFDQDEFSVDSILKTARKKVPENIKIIEEFIKEHDITDKKVMALETTGLLICEKFHKDTITAIRYLNEKTNIDIKMFDIDIFVSDKWDISLDKFLFKAELNEIV